MPFATTVVLVSVSCLAQVNGFHPANVLGLGHFPIVEEGTVGLVYQNGALAPTALTPGLSFNPTRWLGTTVVAMPTTEQDDLFPREGKPPARVKSKQGTTWLTRFNLVNQVNGADLPTVVRRLGPDYDSKIGALLPSCTKEVFVLLDDTAIRKSTTINEMVQTELRAQMERNWGTAFASLLHLPYLTLEHLEVENRALQAQWDEQVKYQNEEATSRRKAEADQAEHDREAAKEAAQHARKAAKERADHKRSVAAVEAQSSQARIEAESLSAVAAIENQRHIDAATAEAEASRIGAEAEVAALRARYAAIQESPSGAAFDLQKDRNAALHNNEKISNTHYVVPSTGIDTVGGLSGSAKSLFERFL